MSNTALIVLLGFTFHSWALRVEEPKPQQKEHLWPVKNGNLLRSGKSSHAAPSDLRAPLWEWSIPGHVNTGIATLGQIESTPLIDRESNIYIATTTFNRIHKLDRRGNELWHLQLEGKPFTGSLYGDALYTGIGTGEALSIDLATGNVNWRKKFDVMTGSDGSSVVVANGTAIFTGTDADYTGGFGGNVDIVALSTADGSDKWRVRQEGLLYNFAPAVVGNRLLHIDSRGKVYCRDFPTGKLMWVSSGSDSPDAFTTAGVAVGPNGMAYTNFNTQAGLQGGVLAAVDIETGEERWRKDLGTEAAAAPTVGPLGPGGRLGVLVGVGPGKSSWTERQADGQGMLKAFDAQTGEPLWTYTSPHQMLHASTGPLATPIEDSIPDTWSTAAISSDGVVYASWQGGRHFAVNGTTGREISSFYNGYGAQAEPAIGDGIVVFATAGKVITFGA